MGLDGSWAGAAAGGRHVHALRIFVRRSDAASCDPGRSLPMHGIAQATMAPCGACSCGASRTWAGRDDCLVLLLVDDAGMALLVSLRDGKVCTARSRDCAVNAFAARMERITAGLIPPARSRVLPALVTGVFCP